MAGLFVVQCSYPPRNIRALVPPDGVRTLDKRAPYLKAHLRDGGVYVLSDWSVDEGSRTVEGQGERQGPDRTTLETGRFTIAIDRVALFEANVVPASKSLRDMTIIAGFSLAVTAACLTQPKACFGSCPTFYTGGGTDALLEAEGFSTSISPALEHTDLDALYRARITGRRFDVVMRNEAVETHVVRHVHLLAAPKPPGGRVIGTSDGEMWQAFDLRTPSRCRAMEGDCVAAVAALDSRERQSRTDGRDLYTREEIDILFDGVPGHEPLGLVVGARQTLLTTYLFYQTLAYMGRAAGGWMAELERNGIREERAHAMRDALGGIEVLVPDAQGTWVSAGGLHETGPLASDVKILPLPAGTGTRVRLRLTRGHWRLDLIALARLGGTVTPLRLRPRDDPFASGSLTAMPGDVHRLVYTLPEDPERQELFLESRGYYLEWLREEWLADEDPVKTLQVLWNPRQALIDLAPAFAQQEAAMEDAFWRSRYVRR
jgi:hypothetical protein